MDATRTAQGEDVLDGEDVKAFLRANPDDIRRDAGLLNELGLRLDVANIIDFGPVALSRVTAAHQRESSERKRLEAVARANFTAQAQTHAAVIDLLESRNHADLARRVDDLARLRFGLAAGVVALEGPGGVPAGWRAFVEGQVDLILGPRRLALMGHAPEGPNPLVNTYRTKYWRVKQLWADTELAAIEAVETKEPVESYNVRWFVSGVFLYCQLPSGRLLAYPFPRVEMRRTSWGAEKRTLTFMGVNPLTRQWQRQVSYGGLLVENIVQAESRDLMAEAMLRTEAQGLYKLVLTVHDELVAEAPEGTGSVKEFETLMATVPEWGQGCPVEAEGWTGGRYRK